MQTHNNHPSPITHHNTNTMTSKAPRQGNVLPRKKLSPEELVSVQFCLNNVIRELEAKKANNGGKMSHGAISRTVSAKQCIFPWISVNQVKNELKRSAKLEVKSSTTSMYTTSGSSLFQPSTATMVSTLTPDHCGPTKPQFLNADGSFALLFPSNLIHNSYEIVEEEEDDNNEGVSEHYDSQFTMMGTLAYETGNNGVLTWGSLEANTNTTKTNKEDMSSTTIQLLVDGPKVPPLLPPLVTNPRCKMH